MKKKFWIALTGVILAVFAYSQNVGGQAQPSLSTGAGVVANQRAILDQYCVTCHNEKARVSRQPAGVLSLALPSHF